MKIDNRERARYNRADGTAVFVIAVLVAAAILALIGIEVHHLVSQAVDALHEAGLSQALLPPL